MCRNIRCDPRGSQRFSVDAAPAGLDLCKHIFAAFDDRLIKCACALNPFKDDRRNHLIVQKCWLAVGNLMLERDPEVRCCCFRRCQLVPMCKNSILNPVQISRIVHMAHEINVVGLDANCVEVGKSCHVNTIGAICENCEL
jgi:hypothetical protein